MSEQELSRMMWRKSSRSGSTGGECVEVARAGERNAVRDSKNPGGGYLTLERGALTALLAEIKRGSYDLGAG